MRPLSLRPRAPHLRGAILSVMALVAAATPGVVAPPNAQAGTGTCLVTNTRTSRSDTSLSSMIGRIRAGDTLTIEGTCDLSGLYLRTKVTLKGVGGQARIQSSFDSRIMSIDGVKAVIEDLTLVGGRVDDTNGGVLRIDNGARVTLRRVSVTGGFVDGTSSFSPAGGGIWVNDRETTLTVVDSVIHGNRVHSPAHQFT